MDIRLPTGPRASRTDLRENEQEAQRGLLPLLLAFTAMFASAPGQSYVFAVFLNHILAGTSTSRTMFSGLFAVSTIASAALSFGLGHVVDRIGLRSVWAIAAGGLAAACLIESFAGSLVVGAVGVVLLRSFGQGSFPLLGTIVVNQRYTGRRGLAMAAAALGVTASTALLPPVIALLVGSVGWREAYRLISVVLFVVVLPLSRLVTTRPTKPIAIERARPVHEVSVPGVAVRGGTPRLSLPDSSAALLALTLCAPSLVTGAVMIHAVSLLAGRGIGTAGSAAALSALGIAAVTGTLLAGALADRITTRELLGVMTGSLTLGGAILLVPGTATSYGAFALIGLSNGIWFVANGLVWARTYGVASLGRIQGLAYASTIAAAGAGPVPLAVSESATGTYLAGLLFLVATAVVALGAACAWHPTVETAATR